MNFTPQPEAFEDEALAKDLGEMLAAGTAPHQLSPNGRRLYEAAARHQARQRSITTGKPQSVPPPTETAHGSHELGAESDLTKVLSHEINRGPEGATDVVSVANTSYDASIQALMGKQQARRKAVDTLERLRATRTALQTPKPQPAKPLSKAAVTTARKEPTLAELLAKLKTRERPSQQARG